MITRTL